MKIILVEPKHPGNVGAVARVMKNFGFTELVLVNPSCDHLSDEAKNRAKHAQEILQNASVISHLSELQVPLIATTSKLGTEHNIQRSPLLPEELVSRVHQAMGIVFGREDYGLFNEEIALCEMSVTIPTSDVYPALNISHAVAIILYVLSQKNHTRTHVTLATRQQKEILYQLLDEALTTIPWKTSSRQRTQYLVFKRIFGKSALTQQEFKTLCSFFKKVKAKE